MSQTNLSMIYMTQGLAGPLQAKRPSDEDLVAMRAIPNRFGRLRLAIDLEEQDCTLDIPVDVDAGNYWSTMEDRRRLGYTWVPAGHMPNITVAPGQYMPGMAPYDPASPPIGAILVPASVEEDPNYESPQPVQSPEPPAESKAVFGPPIEVGEFAGAFYVATENTVPVGTHATQSGREYVFVELKRGFGGLLKLWLPIGG